MLLGLFQLAPPSHSFFKASRGIPELLTTLPGWWPGGPYLQLQHAPNMHPDDLPFDSWHGTTELPHLVAASRPRTNIQMFHVSASVLALATQSACVYCNENTVASCGRCPPPAPRICNGCQARGRACFGCQERESQWSQAAGIVVALERRPCP